MKNLIVILLSIITIFSFFWISVSAVNTECNTILNLSGSVDIKSSLDNCLSTSTLVNWGNAKVSEWFWVQIKKWVNNISIFLWVLAVGSIVFGAFMLTISTWEDEKIKKAKDIVKWWIIWFLWIIFASAIINLIVKIMYSI